MCVPMIKTASLYIKGLLMHSHHCILDTFVRSSGKKPSLVFTVLMEKNAKIDTRINFSYQRCMKEIQSGEAILQTTYLLLAPKSGGARAAPAAVVPTPLLSLSHSLCFIH